MKIAVLTLVVSLTCGLACVAAQPATPYEVNVVRAVPMRYSGMAWGPPLPTRYDYRVEVTLSPELEARAKAVRVVVSSATDAEGHSLSAANSEFWYPAVGAIAGDRSDGPAPLFVSLSGSGLTPRIAAIEGTIEMIQSDRDPNSVVVVEEAATRFSRPLVSPNLAVAGVDVTLLGPNAPMQGMQSVLKGMNEASHPPPAEFGRIGVGQVGVSIIDPERKVVGLEFQRSDGSPLQYNHNGSGHYSGSRSRLSVYDISFFDLLQARFVCWLRTDKSIVRLPFRAKDLPVPTQ